MIGVAQLMVVLDMTVMNIALPSAQQALSFNDVDRQWVVTAYALSFGSLLLFCGRLADLVGRKVTFLTGLAGFAVASAIGGASVNFAMLVTARACQGVFGAMLAPAALSLLTTTFSDPKERGKAFGVYGAIAGAGGAVGLLLGGALTEYLSWRWCLYINLVFAAVAITGGALLAARPAEARRAPSWTYPACCWSPAACSAWSTGSRTPRCTPGARRRPRASWSRRACCWPRSPPGRAAPATRCCRPGWCSTATGAPPTSASSSWARACSASSCS